MCGEIDMANGLFTDRVVGSEDILVSLFSRSLDCCGLDFSRNRRELYLLKSWARIWM
jgi:hypothetical protein